MANSLVQGLVSKFLGSRVPSRKHDPVGGFRFQVKIGGVTMGFRKVSGLKEETEVFEYREGNDPTTVRKFPGLTSYDPVTCEYGVSNDPDAVLIWRKQCVDITSQGQANTRTGGLAGGFRTTVRIILYNHAGQPVRGWNLQNAWCSGLEYTDLDGQSSEPVIVTMTIQHEGMDNLDAQFAGIL